MAAPPRDTSEQTSRTAFDKTADAGRDAAQRAADAGQKVADETVRTARAVTNEAADAGQRAARAGADIARSGAETMQQFVQSGLEMTAQVTERSVDQLAQAFGFSGRQAQEAAQQSSRNIEAIAQCGTVLAKGFQDISREFVGLERNWLERNLDNVNALMRVRTLHDLIAVESRLVRENLEHMLEHGRRIAELSVQVANEASQKISAQAEEQARQRRFV